MTSNKMFLWKQIDSNEVELHYFFFNYMFDRAKQANEHPKKHEYWEKKSGQKNLSHIQNKLRHKWAAHRNDDWMALYIRS